MNKLASQAKDHIRKHAGEWMENYACIGIAAKGWAYVLAGILAAMTIIDRGKKSNSQQSISEFILQQPFGQILLALTVVTLLGYVGWRMIQTFMDPDDKGNDTEGIITRSGFFISGLVYLFFAFSGIRMLFPAAGSSNADTGPEGGRQLLVEKALEQPFGQWLLGIGAVLVIAKGVLQFYIAYSGKFKKNLEEEVMSQQQQATFIHAGRIGYTARGIVLSIIGYFLIHTALYTNPYEAQGIETTTYFLNTPSGPYLMALVATGLLCYGLFMFMKAWYSHMDISSILPSSQPAAS